MKNKVQLFAALAMVLGATSLKAQMNVGATTAPAGTTMLQVTTVSGKTGLAVGYAASAPTDGAIINGNVGIGTTAPSAQLQLGNTTGNKKIVLYDNFGNNNQFYGFGVNGGLLRFQVDALASDFAFNAATSSTTSNEIMRIRGNGNVGIGTSAPNATLDVRGNGLFTNTSAAGLTNILASVGSSMLNVFSPTAASGASTAPETALRLGRPGTSGLRWTPTADFQIGTYATSAAATTSLNIRLGNGAVAVPDVDVMTLQGNGNVGIGTINPTDKLDVSGWIHTPITSGGLRGVTTDNTSYLGLTFPNYAVGWAVASDNTSPVLIQSGWGGQRFLTNGTEAMRILSNGNVGIGTTAPVSTLHVVGTTSTISSGGIDGALNISPSGNSNQRLSLGYDATNNNGTITSVQVGTTITNLIIQAGISAGNSNNASIGWNGGQPKQKFEVVGGMLVGTTWPGVKTLTSGVSAFENAVGIGTSAPSSVGTGVQPLTIQSAVGDNTAFTDNLNSIWAFSLSEGGMGTATGSFELVDRKYNKRAIVIANTGTGNSPIIALGGGITSNTTGGTLNVFTTNVGIGTTAPTATLSVNGTANNSTGSWGVFSDARVKKVDAKFTDGLNVISKINPITFHYNEKAPFQSKDQQIGIIAQELENVAPYMVTKKDYKTKDGDELKEMREVNTQAYIFLLINSIKEQQAMIDTMKAEIEILKKK